MKEMTELSGMDSPLDSSSRAAGELKLSVELELATEQKLEPTPLGMTPPTARVARGVTAPIVDDQSTLQATATVETKPIVDVVDKADVIATEAISTDTPRDYDPGPAVIVTDATIGLPATPEVEILDESADAVIDAEVIPAEDASGVIEVLEPFVIDDRNA